MVTSTVAAIAGDADRVQVPVHDGRGVGPWELYLRLPDPGACYAETGWTDASWVLECAFEPRPGAWRQCAVKAKCLPGGPR